MVKDAQLLVRLESSQKQSWKTHVDDFGQYRDMTDLVEQAVEQKIAEDSSDYSIENDFDIVLSELKKLQNQNSSLKELNEKIERTQATNIQLEEALENILNRIDKEAGNFGPQK